MTSLETAIKDFGSNRENAILRGNQYIDVYHKTIPINFYGITYNFECYVTPVTYDTDPSSIVLLDNIESIYDIEYDYSTGVEIEMKQVDVTRKRYCIELLDKHGELWINFIQNKQIDCRLPNIQNTNCKGLGGILKLIFNFLDHINYNGPIYLEDDSQINGHKTIMARLLSGGNSVYGAYGFVPSQLNSDYNERYLRLMETEIEINHNKPYYQYLNEDQKLLQTIKLSNLAESMKRIDSVATGERYTKIFVNLDAGIKSEIDYVCRPYRKMINENYRNYLNCDVQHGGGIYKQKYEKYALKIKQLKNKCELKN